MPADIFQHDGLAFPQSLPQFQKMFPDDADCAAYLERIRWEDGFRCPHCANAEEPFRFAAKPGVLRCRKCRRDVALTAGTVMERSLLGIGGEVEAPTYRELYSGDWQHPAASDHSRTMGNPA